MNAYAVTLPGDGSIEWVTNYDPALIGARMCLVTPGGALVVDSPGILQAVTRSPSGGLMWWRAERFYCPEGLYVEPTFLEC